MIHREPTHTGSIDFLPMSERNKKIIECLEAGFTPTLPFETSALGKKIQGYILEQVRLGVQLGEAMNQSSETWHDNAPADAINTQSVVLSSQAGKTGQALSSSIRFEYPTEADPQVTLGSVVEILYADDNDPELIYLTGATRDIDTINNHTDAGFSDDFDAVTISSPLGQCLLGANEGEERTYTANGRKHTVQVRAVVHQPLVESN